MGIFDYLNRTIESFKAPDQTRNKSVNVSKNRPVSDLTGYKKRAIDEADEYLHSRGFEKSSTPFFNKRVTSNKKEVPNM